MPGISIDCKAISNHYGLPLITINARDNFGHIFVVVMGYIMDEKEESFDWFFNSSA